MQQYHDLLKHVMENGHDRSDRTGVGTRSVFGPQMSFDLREGFPAVTTKKLFFKGVVRELIWLLSGDTNIKYLQDNGVKIWDAWSDEEGNLGPVYGKQWRRWEGREITFGDFLAGKASKEEVGTIRKHDQIADVIDSIRNNPMSRRHIVSAWNVSDLDEMNLVPCHAFYQFYVTPFSEDVCKEIYEEHCRKPGIIIPDISYSGPDMYQNYCRLNWLKWGYLSCKLTQRSTDSVLGLPFNIASYSLLTHMIAQVTGLEAREFIHSSGDAHIYLNHFDAVKEQLSREPLPLPTLRLNPEIKNIDDFTFEDIVLENYQHHPTIKAPIAV